MFDRGIRTRTPPGHGIRARPLRFDRAAALPRWWCGGDPVRTAMLNAMSLSFPRGEAFFVDAVRHYRDRADGPLRDDIAGFVRQEVAHSREHLAFNRMAADAGYETAAIEAAFAAKLALLDEAPPVIRLVATVALEHFTAIFAHAMLADPRHLDGAGAEARALWRWHAIEEIEHKAVAYDTYRLATRRWPRWKRSLLRVKMMRHVTTDFLGTWIAGTLELLRQDGIVGARARWRLAATALGPGGLLRQALRPYLAFYRPGFHPWRHDDRWLIENARIDGTRYAKGEPVARLPLRNS
jgi:hypothetical protein